MIRCRFESCKKKITLAESVSTSLCNCGMTFCSIHKEIHQSNCLSVSRAESEALDAFRTKLLKSKTVSNLVPRI